MEVSNIAMLRNIMNNISRLNDEWFDTFPTDEGQTGIHDALMYEVMEADKILSAPPRNCDVGTPEEQSARFDAHCRKHIGCLTCPLREKDGGVHKHCEFAWAHMPYEEGCAE